VPPRCELPAQPARDEPLGAGVGGRVAIFDVPQRFSQKWVHDKVPTMDSTEFHAMFHEAATRGWDEDELRQLARMWSEESGTSDASAG
jgi:hypothetical protein